MKKFDNFVLPHGLRDLVVAGDSVEVLNTPVNNGAWESPRIVAWKKALLTPQVESLMSNPDWTVRFLKSFEDKNWFWRFRKNGKKDIGTLSEAFDAVTKASGLAGPPQDNVQATLVIRKYELKDDHTGGCNWWKEHRQHINADVQEVGCFVDQMINVLAQAEEQGSKFLIEQISIVLNKDPGQPLSSITPLLHSDRFYGFRETAISSILEKGFEGIGGALFLPTLNMQDLKHMRPIDLQKLPSCIGDAPVLTSGSGDIVVYSGMLSPNGSRSMKYGVPHISPDEVGKNARLLILMRHIPSPALQSTLAFNMET